jgi:hypothetical protein
MSRQSVKTLQRRIRSASNDPTLNTLWRSADLRLRAAR